MAQEELAKTCPKVDDDIPNTPVRMTKIATIRVPR